MNTHFTNCHRVYLSFAPTKTRQQKTKHFGKCYRHKNSTHIDTLKNETISGAGFYNFTDSAVWTVVDNWFMKNKHAHLAGASLCLFEPSCARKSAGLRQ